MCYLQIKPLEFDTQLDDIKQFSPPTVNSRINLEYSSYNLLIAINRIYVVRLNRFVIFDKADFSQLKAENLYGVLGSRNPLLRTRGNNLDVGSTSTMQYSFPLIQNVSEMNYTHARELSDSSNVNANGVVVYYYAGEYTIESSNNTTIALIQATNRKHFKMFISPNSYYSYYFENNNAYLDEGTNTYVEKYDLAGNSLNRINVGIAKLSAQSRTLSLINNLLIITTATEEIQIRDPDTLVLLNTLKIPNFIKDWNFADEIISFNDHHYIVTRQGIFYKCDFNSDQSKILTCFRDRKFKSETEDKCTTISNVSFKDNLIALIGLGRIEFWTLEGIYLGAIKTISPPASIQFDGNSLVAILQNGMVQVWNEPVKEVIPEAPVIDDRQPIEPQKNQAS